VHFEAPVPPALTRLEWKTRVRRAVPTYAAIALAATTGMTIPIAVTRAMEPSIVVVPAAAPVTIVLPAPVLAPAPPPEEVADAPPPDEPEPAPPRAVAPRLDAGCILSPGDDLPDACAWDDGFPAVSADGTRIATKHYPDDESPNPALYIRLIDVASSRIVGHVLILSPEEAHASDAERPRLQKRIERRVARIQRTLDEQRFRTLVPLGTSDQQPTDPGTDPSAVRAEFSTTAVRIIDPTTSSVVWQDRLETGRTAVDSGEDCTSWDLRTVTAWWDPGTKTVLVEQGYTTGGCMCPYEQVMHARRI
jgi:hypothetical protein